MLAVVLVPALLVAACIAIGKRDKLSSFKGPKLASWTDLWQLWEVYSTWHSVPFSGLPDIYGKVVRIGPNKLLFRDFSAAKEMFKTTNNLPKSDHYPIVAPVAKGKPLTNFFATTDVAYHDRIRKLVIKPFQLSSVTQHEDAVDSVLKEFTDKMDSLIGDEPGRIIDMAPWGCYLALDVIGKVVFGNTYGFIEAGRDFNGMLRENLSYLRYHILVGTTPWLDRLFKQNPIWLWIDSFGIFSSESPIVTIALKAREDEAKAEEKAKAEGGDSPTQNPTTILQEIIEMSKARSDVLNEEEILKISLTVVLAGGESVGSQLAATLYHMVRKPEILSKLQKEIDAVKDENLSFTTLKDLPYLDACVHESLRIFPSNRANQERVVPKNGMNIDGTFVPGGTVVCINPWITNRDVSVYGDDVETFNPDRWLNTTDANRKHMKSAIANFGFGKYGCMGQHIAIMETFKFLATMVKKYDMRPSKPDWKLHLSEFIQLSDIHVELSRRT